jgi:hypothetical protein
LRTWVGYLRNCEMISMCRLTPASKSETSFLSDGVRFLIRFDQNHPTLLGPYSRFCAVEVRGNLSRSIAVEVVCELLTRGWLRSSFFGSDGGGSGWTFFNLFSFLGIGFFSEFLVCRLCRSVGTARSLLVLMPVLARNKHNQTEKDHRKQNNLECGPRFSLGYRRKSNRAYTPGINHS